MKATLATLGGLFLALSSASAENAIYGGRLTSTTSGRILIAPVGAPGLVVENRGAFLVMNAVNKQYVIVRYGVFGGVKRFYVDPAVSAEAFAPTISPDGAPEIKSALAVAKASTEFGGAPPFISTTVNSSLLKGTVSNVASAGVGLAGAPMPPLLKFTSFNATSAPVFGTVTVEQKATFVLDRLQTKASNLGTETFDQAITRVRSVLLARGFSEAP